MICIAITTMHVSLLSMHIFVPKVCIWLSDLRKKSRFLSSIKDETISGSALILWNENRWYTWQYYRVLHSLRAMDRDYHSQNRTQTRNIAMSSGRKRLPYARIRVLTLCYYTELNLIFCILTLCYNIVIISCILTVCFYTVLRFCVINLCIDSVSICRIMYGV